MPKRLRSEMDRASRRAAAGCRPSPSRCSMSEGVHGGEAIWRVISGRPEVSEPGGRDQWA
jgi:hypothetical protein